ncbi:MAG: exodeoxyribonuclease III [Propionibacteriaceae bacterium]|jgi:exodeoxyribonuclease-3|nr:exodeoxyribonuclease III [Propionibacteriaceae bacterium]
MRIGTFNVNGIRACVRRGFEPWLAQAGLDVLVLQEVRCPVAELPDVFGGWHSEYFQGNQPGRNGVMVLSKIEPSAVREGFGYKDDPQGRYLETDFDGLTIACLYLPKGGSPAVGTEDHLERYHRKMAFMAAFKEYVREHIADQQAAGREYLLMGDMNIAHTEADLKNWRSNQETDGFLPEERAWFGELLGVGLVDVVRQLHPGEDGPYSWWSWRGRAFTSDAGWRIDYHLATPGWAARATSGGTIKEPSYEARLSDHAAVIVEYSTRHSRA